MTCPYCAKRPLKRQGDRYSITCGNSYCQEANFHANAACNTRSKKRKAEHRQRQQECETLASR